MKKYWIGLLLGLAAGGAIADTPGQLAGTSQPITSIEEAEKTIAAVEAQRAQILARHVEQERTCHDKFFVNRCLDEARARRREALRPLEALQLEAERFERQQRAASRDEGVAQRRAEAGEKAAEAARAVVPPPREPAQPSGPQGRPRTKEAAPAPTPEQEREAARERADNEAAYARKVAAAKARQEAVARRKAEKEQKEGRAAGN